MYTYIHIDVRSRSGAVGSARARVTHVKSKFRKYYFLGGDWNKARMLLFSYTKGVSGTEYADRQRELIATLARGEGEEERTGGRERG